MLGALGLIAALGIGISAPEVTYATPPDSVVIENSTVNDVVAYDGGFVAFGCTSYSGRLNSTNATYVGQADQVRNTIPSVNDSGLNCTNSVQMALSDGTLFGVHYSTTQNVAELVARKNGRELWRTDVSSPTNCYTTSSVTYEMRPNSMSEGADGNIYTVMVPMDLTPQGCNDRLMGFDRHTGQVIMDIAIGGSWASNVSAPSSWTYDDKIIVLDRTATYREFSYAGVENTAASQQLPGSIGTSARWVAANEAGTVFAWYPAVTWNSTSSRLVYHKADGSYGYIEDGYTDVSGLTLTEDGDIVGYSSYGRTLSRFDIDAETVSQETLEPQISGYPQKVLAGYLEDTDGNALIQWQLASSNWTDIATSVELYDSTADSTSVLFLLEAKASDPTNYPPAFATSSVTGGSAINAGYFLLPVCEADASACYSNTDAPDTAIYKIATGDFGSPPASGFKHNDFTSQKLEYVALGDSFSSGEGVEPFTPGTDDPGVNVCHRSEDAYPMLLEEDEDLNLNLTAFVACSGATMSDITGVGQWGEPRQLDALSESTDVVTLTIGGNDIGFGEVISVCTRLNTQPSTWTTGQDAYDRYKCAEQMEYAQSILYGSALLDDGESFSTKLSQTLADILNSVGEETAIYVLGYPNIFPESSSLYTPCTWGALAGAGLTSARSVEESEIGLARQITGALNSSLSTAAAQMEDPRIQFVDISTPFTGHEICGLEDGYMFHINYSQVNGSFHPNAAGQQAYKLSSKGAIG